MTTPKPCNCGGGTASSPTGSSGGTVFQIRLRNGNYVGRFGTESAANHALRTTFNNAGTVVPR